MLLHCLYFSPFYVSVHQNLQFPVFCTVESLLCKYLWIMYSSDLSIWKEISLQKYKVWILHFEISLENKQQQKNTDYTIQINQDELKIRETSLEKVAKFLCNCIVYQEYAILSSHGKRKYWSMDITKTGIKKGIVFTIENWSGFQENCRLIQRVQHMLNDMFHSHRDIYQSE